MSLVLDDGDVRLYHGDALTVLQTLEAESVHMCVTSPPFYGLRDYGVDGQIGLEETPEQWVASLVAVFREVRRVLRADGTLWLEIGDSYAANAPGSLAGGSLSKGGKQHRANRGVSPPLSERGKGLTVLGGSSVRGPDPSLMPRSESGVKPKDLIGAPWQLAFALRADGWYLRSDIVWARPNPMPESVTDRPTKSHSYIFLLSKQPRYFFDQEAVREKASENTHQRYAVARETPKGREGHNGWDETTNAVLGARNVRSVWTIATQPYPEAHFATFPEELARRCILAGTSERGCCPECGAPWVRDFVRELVGDGSPRNRKKSWGGAGLVEPESGSYSVTTLGWHPSCACRRNPYSLPCPSCSESAICVPEATDDGDRGVCDSCLYEWPISGTVSCVVLDPFVGSGTVPHVARKHGRHAIGIDLSVSYLELASRRLQQLSLFA